ncbi:hypothetical protein BH20ACT6_BH20ACT6_11430 [soil metagenome]
MRTAPPSGAALILTLARVGWLAGTALTVSLFVAGLPEQYRLLPTGVAGFVVARDTVVAGVWLAVAVLVFARRSADWAALVVAFFLVTFGVGTFSDTLDALVAAQPAWQPVVEGIEALGICSLVAALLLFPDGRFVPRRTAGLLAVVVALQTLGLVLPGSPVDETTWSDGLWVAVYLPLLAVLAAGQVHRYRRAGPVQRQQTKWAAFGIVAALLGLVGLLAAQLAIPALHFPGPVAGAVVNTIAGLLLLPVPVTVGVALLRHRLWDVDAVTNRTLVYGSVSAALAAGYVLVVGGLGVLLSARGNLLLSLLGAGLVAVAFAPLRDRVQRGVNRLMYGERDDPYAALTGLGRRLEGALAPEEVLPTIVATVARTLRLPYAAIWLVDGPVLRLGAVHGEHAGPTQVQDIPQPLSAAALQRNGALASALTGSGADLVPVAHRGELVGALGLVPRRAGEQLSDADRRLLRDIASQLGAAVHAVRLTDALRASLADLRRSREALVAAQDDERRRIQRDLHDGLGPVLASMRLRLEACLDPADDVPAPMRADLERLYELVGEATADIRRLVYDLRPPVLDQLGLVPALQQHCDRFTREASIAVDFRADTNVPVPAAAEVALLRVVQEALVNVGKHARASRVDVRLHHRDGRLDLTVDDDGVGISGSNGTGHDGTGVVGMRRRAELLGGSLLLVARPGSGCRVTLSIPTGGAR